MMYPNLINQTMSDGIFNDLAQLDVPWTQISPAALNYGYYLQSARKLISPFVIDLTSALTDEVVEPLTTVERNMIALTIYTTFKNKWNRLWDIYSIEYNPLYNYTLTEEETINSDDSGTFRDTGTQQRVVDTDTTNTGTDTVVTDRQIKHTGTDTTVTDTDTTNTGTVGTVGSSDTLDGIFGFNSDDSVGSDTRDVDTTGTRTDNLAGTVDTTETETKNLTTDDDATETETQNLAGTVDTTDTRTDNLTRTSEEQSETTRSLEKNGNIGFNTPQEMLVADLELWQWNFFKSVFDDIDSVLTMSIY